MKSDLYIPEWAYLKWDADVVSKREARFLREHNLLARTFASIHKSEQADFVREVTNSEAARTPVLNKSAIFTSDADAAKNHAMLLDIYNQRTPLEKQGYADMMADVYKTCNEPLNQDQLFAWHGMLMRGRTDVQDVGRYRTEKDRVDPRPNESCREIEYKGVKYREMKYFSNKQPAIKTAKMNHFIAWYNNSDKEAGKSPLPILWRAGIAYYYFISIFPFERGNGRIARALAEKALSRWDDMAAILALSKTIHTEEMQYHNLLEQINDDRDVEAWLEFFANTVIDAQQQRQQMLDLFIAKRYSFGSLNERQGKVVSRLFRETAKDFKSGFSVEKYILITGATPAVAAQDLANLMMRGVLICISDDLYRLKYTFMG